jgi:hypothetical protein
MSNINKNILLNLDHLVKKFQYSHLWQCRELLLDSKLEILELIDNYKDIILSEYSDENVHNQVEKEIYSLLVDLEFLNKNITTLKMAIKLKYKECVQIFDAGEHFLN